jgi:hypothetical protein
MDGVSPICLISLYLLFDIWASLSDNKGWNRANYLPIIKHHTENILTQNPQQERGGDE